MDIVFLDDHLPIAAPHGRPELGFVTEEDVPVREVFLFEQIGFETCSVPVFRVGPLKTSDVRECRKQVETDYTT